MRILFTGGGTLGSVTPLLAVTKKIQEDGHQIYFVGTSFGPERILVEAQNIPFHRLVAPKLRRYMTWRHFVLPFELVVSFFQAWRTLSRIRPDLIVSAGGFVAVPLVFVGWLRGIKSMIHQQDLHPGLANKIMAPFAKEITVAFERSLSDFTKGKATWVGNPVKDLTPTTNSIIIDSAYSTVFIFGGGTGAQAINELVTKEICEIANIIHVIGKGRGGGTFSHPRYQVYELLNEEMNEAYAHADIVVCRAGLGTISELATLSKPAIVIPMPGTHQEANTEMLEEYDAAVVLDQRILTPQLFQKEVATLLHNTEKQKRLGKQIHLLIKENSHQAFIDRLYAHQ